MATTRLDQRNQLHMMIEALFSKAELEELYFKSGLDYEDTDGNKSQHITELIRQHFSQERKLAALCKQMKPGHDWPFL
jgi:hypothetical protein